MPGGNAGQGIRERGSGWVSPLLLHLWDCLCCLIILLQFWWELWKTFVMFMNASKRKSDLWKKSLPVWCYWFLYHALHHNPPGSHPVCRSLTPSNSFNNITLVLSPLGCPSFYLTGHCTSWPCCCRSFYHHSRKISCNLLLENICVPVFDESCN